MAGLQLLNKEELTPIQYHTMLYEELINNLDNMVSAGIIDEDTATAQKAQALVDLNNRLLESENITDEDIEALAEGDYDDDDDDDDEDANYSSSSNIAEFSVGNRFGAALLELGEAAGYQDLELLISDIAQVTENNPEDIVGLITGETQPADELAEYLARCFELNDEYTLDLRLAAMEARGETLDDEADEEDEAEYSQVAQLQNRIAEFEQNQQIRDALSELELRARECMPPVAIKVLLGEFQLESDRVAAFSKTAQLNNVGPDVELYALQKIVELFEKTGLNQVAMFQNYSGGTAAEPTDEDKEIEAQARRNFELRQARNHNLA